MEHKHIVLLMGGKSSEHDVSMASGTKVNESLDRERYRITPVVIRRDGLWEFPDKGALDIFGAVAALGELRPDCVFIALHGTYGEDGRIQGMLDMLGLPYTSSDCASSALAMDKVRCKAVVRDAGIRVADHVMIRRKDWESREDAQIQRVTQRLGFPCVAKTPCQGSSVGMAIPRSADELRKCMPEILAFGDSVMVEAFVRGKEITCAVLDTGAQAGPTALPVTEIRPVSSAYFDYHAKYTPGASEEITPAQIPAELRDRLQQIAVAAHVAVGCSIWSRSDMIVDAQGPVWIEVNTVPGLTPTSLFPQAAAAAGISYAELMSVFIEAAIARNARSKKGC